MDPRDRAPARKRETLSDDRPKAARDRRPRRGEAAAAAVSFVYFFALLSGYYMLRPIRDEMGISAGRGRLDELFTWTFVVMIAVVPAWSAIVARFPRRRVIPVAYHACAACLVAFWIAWNGEVPRALLAQVFFVWLSVYNLFVVSVFWSFMADVWREDQARRLFGVIAAGGSAGAVVGPALTAALVGRVGIAPLFLLGALLLEGCVLCAWWLARLARGRLQGGVGQHADERIGGSPFAGFSLALRSPYLLAVCAQMGIYSLVSTILYFEQARIVSEAIAEPAGRTALFAKVDLVVNLLAATIQAGVTGPLLTRLGLGVALTALPALSIAGLGALAASPTLAVLVVVGVARRAVHYAIERPAREVLFTVVGAEEKYKAKNFVDTVVYRGGDAASGWFHTGLSAAGLAPTALLATVMPVAALGIPVGIYLARRQGRLAAVEAARAAGGGAR